MDPTTLPSPLPSVLSRSWQYGHTADYTGVGQTANGLPQLKFLVEGSVTWIVASVTALAEAARQLKKKDQVGIAELRAMLSDLDNEKLNQLFAASGLKLYHAVQHKDEAIFVPGGWLVAEAVHDGVLVHGTRRTQIYRSPEAAATYGDLIGASRVDKLAVEKMEMASKAMDTAEEGS